MSYSRCVLIGVCLLMGGVSCSPQREENKGPRFTVTVDFSSAPTTSVTVKLVQEAEAARTLVAMARQEDLSESIPASRCQEFYNALPAAAKIHIDPQGRATFPHLPRRGFVAASDGTRFWLANTAEIHGGNLWLGTEQAGGRHALNTLIAQPLILEALSTATLDALRDGKVVEARALARCARSDMLLARIDQAKVDALLDEAEHELAQKNYDSAQQLALSAEAAMPGQMRTRRFLDHILAEFGGELHSLTGHYGVVTCVAYNPDGKLVVSGGEDRTLRIWDVAQRRQTLVLEGHRDKVTSAGFNPDGNVIVSGSLDSTLRLWDAVAGRELRSTEPLGWQVTCTTFSPDGKFVLSGSDDNKVKLWKAPDLELVRTFTGHGWRVTSVAFSSDGRQSLSSSEDDSAKLWDLSSGHEVRTLRSGLTEIRSVAFSPDGRFALSGGGDKLVKLWNLQTGVLVAKFGGHGRLVRSVAFTLDGRFGISSSDDGTIKIWDVGARQDVRTFVVRTAVTSVAVSPNGRELAGGCADGTVRIWQLPREVWPRTEEARN